jgi:diguanylate cyclase (GGDEF)-like protein
MVSLRWYVVVFAAVVVALVGGAVLIQQGMINRLLYDDAVATGRDWTGFLVAEIDDLEAIAAGRPPSDDTRFSLSEAQQAGGVFLYKIFDAHGLLRLTSEAGAGHAELSGNLQTHNAEAAEAVAAGRPLVEAKTGQPPDRPAYYSEAYVPVFADGRVVAVVETYVDQTAKRQEFQGAFAQTATALGLLIVFAFGMPTAALYVRTREQQRAVERINYLANFDALSALANRSRFTDALMGALAQASASAAPVAVLCVDIDRFRDVNDAFGLDVGDMLIRIVADRLRMLAAPGDTVGRLGGDEFALVRPAAGDMAGVDQFARFIVGRVTAAVTLGDHVIRPSVCVGIAIAPDHGTEPARLIKSAELALAKAKLEGPARIRMFSADLDEELNARLELERTILNAVEYEGFRLFFQPLFNTRDDRLIGFEALLRLPDGERDFIPPATFIPVAERTGLIDRIGAWVLQEACATAAAWPGELTVAVNLSPAQFAECGIVEHVSRALETSGLHPCRLELEITESLLIEDTESVLRQLGRLKALGAAIVMDDFGTGYSSLSYLWRFPFDKIKIDQSFLHALDGSDTPAEKIIRTIVALGRAMRVRVTAEGVETANHAEFIRTIDCDEMQGFYFGCPAPAADLGGLILAAYRREKIAPPPAPVRLPATA